MCPQLWLTRSLFWYTRRVVLYSYEYMLWRRMQRLLHYSSFLSDISPKLNQRTNYWVRRICEKKIKVQIRWERKKNAARREKVNLDSLSSVVEIWAMPWLTTGTIKIAVFGSITSHYLIVVRSQELAQCASAWNSNLPYLVCGALRFISPNNHYFLEPGNSNFLFSTDPTTKWGRISVHAPHELHASRGVYTRKCIQYSSPNYAAWWLN